MKLHLTKLSTLTLDIRPGDIVFLKGNLGAGKTTLAGEIATRLGIDRNTIKSPTYTYVQKYTTKTGGTLYHFDLYRITDYDTFLNIGGEDYLNDPEAIKLIEWPEILANTFVPNVEITLSETDDPEVREIEVVRR